MNNLEEIEIKTSKLLRSNHLSTEEKELIIGIVNDTGAESLESNVLLMSRGMHYAKIKIEFPVQIEIANSILTKLNQEKLWMT